MADKKEITDHDLDVMNAMKDFPLNENDAFIYLRGGINPLSKKTIAPFIAMAGTNNATTALFIPIIMQNEFLRKAILNSVLVYLNTDMATAKQFVKNVKVSNLIL
jgi:hypothetical protein